MSASKAFGTSVGRAALKPKKGLEPFPYFYISFSIRPASTKMRKGERPIDSKSLRKGRSIALLFLSRVSFRRKGLRIPNPVGAGRLCLPQLGKSHPRATTLFVRPFPLPFSLSVFNGWGGSRRSEAYHHADYQIRAPSQRFDGMAQPTQERLCHMGTHGWKQSLWF